MNSAIKLVILLLLPLTMQAQDTIVNPRQYVPEDPESVFFGGEFYRGYSVNNSSWENYSIWVLVSILTGLCFHFSHLAPIMGLPMEI